MSARELRAAGLRALAWGPDPPRGTPLALLHGFLGRAESFEELAARLPGDRTAVAFDLPGHGPVSPVDPARGFEGAVDDLAAALRALFGGPWHVLGYSLGARLALGIAVRHPATCATLTLAGVHPGLANAAERATRADADARWAARLRGGALDAFVAAWEAQPLFATQSGLDPARLARQRALRLSHDPLRLAAAFEATALAAMPDRAADLPALTMPVHLVAGAHDAKFVALAHAMRALLRHGRLTVVDGTGHNVLLERPEALAGALD